MASPVIARTFETKDGVFHPFGASICDDGVNFALCSTGATGVELLLFDEHNSPDPCQTIKLQPFQNKTFHVWHIFVKGLKAGAHYAFRVSGPGIPEAGYRYNRNKVLVDPYSRGNTNTLWKRGDACNDSDNCRTSMRSVVMDATDYD